MLLFVLWNWLGAFLAISDLFINLLSLSVLSKLRSKFEIPEIGGPVNVDSCNRDTSLGRPDPWVPAR